MESGKEHANWKLMVLAQVTITHSKSLFRCKLCVWRKQNILHGHRFEIVFWKTQRGDSSNLFVCLFFKILLLILFRVWNSFSVTTVFYTRACHLRYFQKWSLFCSISYLEFKMCSSLQWWHALFTSRARLQSIRNCNQLVRLGCSISCSSWKIGLLASSLSSEVTIANKL